MLRRVGTGCFISTGRSLDSAGSAHALAAGIERYRAAGAGSPCIGPIPGTDFEATLRAGLTT